MAINANPIVPLHYYFRVGVLGEARDRAGGNVKWVMHTCHKHTHSPRAAGEIVKLNRC